MLKPQRSARLIAVSVHATYLALLGCAREQPRSSSDSTAVVTNAAPDSVAKATPAPAPSATPKRQRESYVPFWSVSFQHDEDFIVELAPPFAACDPARTPPLPRDSLWPNLNHHGVIVAATRKPFDSIAAVFGYRQREGRWVSVDPRGMVMEAVEIRGASWRGLRGGRVGAIVPSLPHPTVEGAKTPGVGPQDNILAVVSHPSGCSIVLAFHPNADGGADSVAVRHILESVRTGSAAPASDFLPPPAQPVTPISDEDEPVAPSADMAERRRRREYGIGLVYLVADTSGSRTDTIAVYGQASERSSVVARYVGTPDAPLSLLAGDSLASSAIEFAYETQGLPIIERGADTSWVRIVYATDTTGAQPRTGWVRTTPGHVSDTTWTALFLATGALLFADASERAYYESPGGKEVSRSTLRDGHTHEVIAAQGPWLLVKAVTPPEYCEEPAQRARNSYVWIRALDERGRPRVFYAPRGC